MKGTDHFKRTIQMFLEQRAAEDELFAKSYRNPAKNIDDCVTYILNYVQKSGCNGFTDGEIYGQAVHYYQKYNVIQSNDIKSFYTHGYTLDFGCYSCDNKSALTLSKHIEKRSILSAPLRKIIVTSHFGRRTDPFTKKSRWHNGVDLKAVAGEPTYAMFAGVVAEVGFDNSRGRYVIVRSGRYAFEYYHLSRCLVSEGSLVLAGDSIGNAGSTGRSTGPHLHITLKCDGVSINPAILIDRIRRHRY